MAKYELIDPVLSQWAMQNGLHWYTEYQDVEVRTFYLNENRRDRVQVAVDVPDGGKTIIRIGQSRRGIWRLNRSETIKSTYYTCQHHWTRRSILLRSGSLNSLAAQCPAWVVW